jgi:hypothetical protein
MYTHTTIYLNKYMQKNASIKGNKKAKIGEEGTGRGRRSGMGHPENFQASNHCP